VECSGRHAWLEEAKSNRLLRGEYCVESPPSSVVTGSRGIHYRLNPLQMPCRLSDSHCARPVEATAGRAVDSACLLEAAEKGGNVFHSVRRLRDLTVEDEAIEIMPHWRHLSSGGHWAVGAVLASSRGTSPLFLAEPMLY
jgi:hypothetical protein